MSDVLLHSTEFYKLLHRTQSTDLQSKRDTTSVNFNLLVSVLYCDGIGLGLGMGGGV
jgi:hypothetical protein